MLFFAFSPLFPNKPKCNEVQQNLPPSTETVCDYQNVSRRYRPIGMLWAGGEDWGGRKDHSLYYRETGWDRSFTPEDLETAVRKGGGGSRGMVFAPMQAEETGSESTWGAGE